MKPARVVSVDEQIATRAHAVARIEALAKRRDDLVRRVRCSPAGTCRCSVRDLTATNPGARCAPGRAATIALPSELKDVLGRFLAALYRRDRSLNRPSRSPAGWTRFQGRRTRRAPGRASRARLGYRPADLALGLARPALAYPRIRDLADATLRLLATDPLPPAKTRAAASWAPSMPDESTLFVGAHPSWTRRSRCRAPRARRVEDRPAHAARHGHGRRFDDPHHPLAPAVDARACPGAFVRGGVGGQLGRRRDAALHREARRAGLGALVTVANGPIAAPFLDADKDGLADVDSFGRFVTQGSATAPTPFVVLPVNAESANRRAP